MAKMRSLEAPTRGHQSPEKRDEIKKAIRAAVEILSAGRKRSFEHHARVKSAKPATLIAYDFETTRIKPGTPRPLYLTAYGRDFSYEAPVSNMQSLTKTLRTHFLTPEHQGSKFVAWNGNRFDAYFVAAALVRQPDLLLRPYMTKSKALRGLRVTLTRDADGNPLSEKGAPSWEFLDGIAMLGLAGVSLEKLLDNFAPDHPKHVGIIDFEAGEEFDATNPKHRAYAMGDSVGLYHAMTRAQRIMLDAFNEPLAVTMGGVCVKIFQAHIPKETRVLPLHKEAESLTREYVMRGGFCFCVRRYFGHVWKYDINQAYASAMREAKLPSGLAMRVMKNLHALTGVYMVRLTAKHDANKVPFYYRTVIGGRLVSQFSKTVIHDTWITSIEHAQLKKEGWTIQVIDAWAWDQTFSMRAYVDKLETMRMNCPGGPSGPQGTMYKATGNHSYGKTVEKIEPIEYVLSLECPPDCLPFYGDGSDPIEHVYYRIDLDRKSKDYHQPQIGAWITAHVRMVLRRAILLAPDAWLYADTDCLVFSRDVTALLDIDPKRYGAWKIEEAGTVYQIIAKKVYTQVAPADATAEQRAKIKKSAKGMHVKKLTPEHFTDWFEGAPPEQEQTQVNNFLSVLAGSEMFRLQARGGTDVLAIEAKAAQSTEKTAKSSE